MKNKKIFKHKGNMGDIIGSMVVISAVLVILTSCINCFTILSKKIQLDRFARTAVLQLEIQGDLSASDISALITKVESLNLHNINIEVNEGTGKALYGQLVNIKISASATGQDLGLFASLPIWNNTFDFSVNYPSISKAAMR